MWETSQIWNHKLLQFLLVQPQFLLQGISLFGVYFQTAPTEHQIPALVANTHYTKQQNTKGTSLNSIQLSKSTIHIYGLWIFPRIIHYISQFLYSQLTIQPRLIQPVPPLPARVTWHPLSPTTAPRRASQPGHRHRHPAPHLGMGGSGGFLGGFRLVFDGLF